MSTLATTERGRVGTVLVMAGALLVAIASVMFIGQAPVGATDDTAPQCVVVADGSLTMGDMGAHVVGDVTVTLVAAATVGMSANVRAFSWTAVGGIATITYSQSSTSGQSGPGTSGVAGGGSGAIASTQICTVPAQAPTSSTTTSSTTSTTTSSTSSTTSTTTSTTSTTSTTTSTTTTTLAIDETTTTTVAGGEEPTTTTTMAETTTTTEGSGNTTTTVVAGPDAPELPDTGAGQLLALIAGGLGFMLMGSGSLVIASERRRMLDL